MSDPDRQPALVVGVGASAGGLDAFKSLLKAMPGDRGLALLLVQHLDPSHESLLAELLAPCTDMMVREAEHGVAVEPNSIYIIQPGTALAVQDGSLALSEPTRHRGVALPVDHLFRSLARDYGSRAVGVVLSGAGSDGSAGVRDIKAVGGLTIAQDPELAAQTGMPQSAVDTGVVDLILDIAEIPEALERFASLPAEARLPAVVETSGEGDDEPADGIASFEQQDLGRLTALLEAQCDFDLRVYKRGTIERRVLRRMTLAGIDNVADYFELLRSDDTERQTLVRDMLISVTEFFRDPEAFAALRETIITPLVAQADAGTSLRAWVPGCATGEEAYSIGMELLDEIERQDKRLHVQIFATDIDRDALAFARAGVYPPSITEYVSPRRLQHFFQPMDGRGFQIRGFLRDSISFAAHDITKDPPFSRMHLVSCRNVLIYLTQPAQKHVLSVLHYALHTDGGLFLSTSETTGPRRELFSTLSKKHRIYKKVGQSRPISVSRARHEDAKLRDDERHRLERKRPQRRSSSGGDLARRAVLQAMVPPTLVVAGDGSVLFSHGELSEYLRIPEGDNPTLELGVMLRPPIATRTRAALYKCRRVGAEVVATSSPDGGTAQVRITARPAPQLGDDTVILSFEPYQRQDPPAPSPEERSDGNAELVIDQLERELQATREDLRNTVEELETSNEELRSSNEESMSMNEELQSANEELEATTEELRSLNEELTTVNSQLREKVEQLEVAHDDLSNFFASTKIATLFLDENLCIKRFTPAARDYLGIGEVDVGRYVGDIARELLQVDLVEQARDVLENLNSRESELHTANDRWITRTILPYRTETRRIEGVVVTYRDVTDLRAANRTLERHSARLELAWEVAGGGVYEHRVPPDDDQYYSEQWARVLGFQRRELPDPASFSGWFLDRIHPDDRDGYQRATEDFFRGRTDGFDVELRLRHRTGEHFWVRVVSRAVLRDDRGQTSRVIGMMIDISDIKRAEHALRESESRFREMADGLPHIVWVHDADGELQYVNQTFCDYFDVDRDEMTAARWRMLVHPADLEDYTTRFREALGNRVPFHTEVRVRRGDGEWRWFESWGAPRIGDDGEYFGIVGTSTDITERKGMEDALRESEHRLVAAKEAAELGIFDWHPDAGALHWDERVKSLWGAAEDQKGDYQAFLGGVHADDRDDTRRAIERAFAPGSNGYLRTEFRLAPDDGEASSSSSPSDDRWVAAHGLVVEANDGPRRLVGTVQDISAVKRSERRKDDFLAMLSHELRNPLSAIRSAVEVAHQLVEGQPALARAFSVLERQSAHVARLVDRLLDLSRITRGKVVLETQVVELRALVHDSIESLSSQAEAKQVEIVGPDAEAEGVWVEGDPDRLEQVFVNLVGNSVKFTRAGDRIDVSVETDGDEATVTVRDSGIGFDKATAEFLFEAFEQGPRDLARAEGGLGLGLALARELVELHGGSIAARSDGADKGAEFAVTLPRRAQRGAERPPNASRSVASMRVLVIEDNEDGAEMLRQALTLRGHDVTVATRGQTGIDLALDETFDAVLCDLGLPDGTTGYDVARTLRSHERTRALPLVAVTGYGMSADKRRALDAGFDAHLTKPVNTDQVADVLSRFGRRSD